MNIKIIDNFLNKEDFQELCALKLKKISDNEIAVYHNSIDKNNNYFKKVILLNAGKCFLRSMSLNIRKTTRGSMHNS